MSRQTKIENSIGIPWGEPDRNLARAVCDNIERAMPPTPWVARRRTGDFILSACGWAVVALIAIVVLAAFGGR